MLPYVYENITNVVIQPGLYYSNFTDTRQSIKPDCSRYCIVFSARKFVYVDTESSGYEIIEC